MVYRYLHNIHWENMEEHKTFILCMKLQICSFPVAQMVEHGASNAKIMGLIPRESKINCNLNAM